MTQVKLCVEVPEERYRQYKAEADRRGVSVEDLVRQTLQFLFDESERQEIEGTDHIIIPS